MTERKKKPTSPHTITVHAPTQDFTEFLQCVRHRHIALSPDAQRPVVQIKYRYSGSVELQKRGEKNVMQPGTRLYVTAMVSTAYDPFNERAYKLHQYTSPLQPLSTTQAVLDALRLEGYAVLEGAWTLESAQAALAQLG